MNLWQQRLKFYVLANLTYKGTYIGIRLRTDCAKALHDWCLANHVPDPVKPQFLHITVFKSEIADIPIDTTPVNFMVNAKNVSIVKFNRNRLVLIFNFDYIDKLRNKLIAKEHHMARQQGIKLQPFLPFVQHMVISEYASVINDEKLADLNKKWKYPIVIGQPYRNDSILPHAPEYTANSGHEKKLLIDQRDKILKRIDQKQITDRRKY